MNVVLRADASHQIGSGHVMRCLTLADALTETGATCQFICRHHQGHLADYIRAKGYRCHVLTSDSEQADIALPTTHTPPLHHADWLGVPWAIDAKQTAMILDTIRPDWLVVDHYALDDNWEQALQPYYYQLMVMDDLADRLHLNANILLDQTLGRQDSDYRALVNPTTKLLLGAEYALLRPEFAAWREVSLKRRDTPELKNILVNLGGVDKDNVTADVLQALAASELPADCEIIVVMGASAPHLASVQQQAQASDLNIRVLSGVSNMAQLMADADMAIGAAGSTSWERCCLGLPSIMFVLAENQKVAAKTLFDSGCVLQLFERHASNNLCKYISQLRIHSLSEVTDKAKEITDGCGTSKLVNILTSEEKMISIGKYSLRAMVKDDLATVLSWRNADSVRKNMYTAHIIGKEEHRTWFERESINPTTKLCIFEKDGVAKGFISFTNISSQHSRASWAFYSGNTDEKGLGTPMEVLALSYAFEKLKLNKLCCEVLSFNEPVINFHKKFGFTVEGIMKEHYYRDAEKFDVYGLALFSEEWNEIKEGFRVKLESR